MNTQTKIGQIPLIKTGKSISNRVIYLYYFR